MKKNNERFGTFSSSAVWKLMCNDKAGGFGAPAKKYIKQVNYEILLGRAINPERESRPTEWGKFIQRRTFDLLTTEYKEVSQERLFHPKFSFWSGMPDVLKDKIVGDIKCPFSLEVFCDKVESLKDIEVYKKEFPEDYWQHVSNAILMDSNFAEAIIYCPYLYELVAIREMTSDFEGDQNKVAFIHFAADNELPYLLDGGHYKNLNIVQFEIPQSDKDLLTERICKAGELLQSRPLTARTARD